MFRTFARYALAPVTVTALAVLAVPASAAAAPPPARSTAGANAFGSELNLGAMLGSGPSAHVALCTRNVGTMDSDRTAALDVPGVGHVGAVTTHVGSDSPNGLLRSLANTHTGATNLFGGQLSLQAVTTQASATRHASSTALGGGTTYVNLVIAGQPVPAKQPANSQYAIPGVGSVRLNVQQRTDTFANPAIAVSALVITVSAGNSLGLPAGTIVIGRSAASLNAPTERAVTGYAYGSTAVLAKGTVTSGRTAPVALPCGGTAGQTVDRNATARSELPSVLETGDVDSHARSSESADTTSVLTSNHIASVSLLGGVVSAQGITTRANAVRNSENTLLRNSSGTTVGSLTINGTQQGVTGEPNQMIDVPDVGTLYVHKVVQTSNGLTVNGLQLVLTKAQGGLDVGSVITIGAASAGVLSK